MQSGQAMIKHSNAARLPSYRLLLAALSVASLLIIGGMMYVSNLTAHVSLHHQLESNANQLLLDASLAHLWLAESLNENADEDKDKIPPLLNKVDHAFHTLNFLQSHQHLFVTHTGFNTFPKYLHDAERAFKRLRVLAQNHLSNPQKLGLRSTSDSEFDALFSTFESMMIAVQTSLHEALEQHLTNLERGEFIITLVSACVAFIVILLIMSFLRRQRAYYCQQLRTEEQKHDMEDKYRGLIEQSPFSIQILTPEGGFIQANKAWETLWNTKQGNWTEYNFLKDPFILESSAFKVIQRGFAGELIVTDVININPQHTATSASPFFNHFIRMHIYPVFDRFHQLEQVVIIYTDVSDTHLQHAFQLGQSNILRKIANPTVSLEQTLTELTHFVEQLVPDAMVSIILLDDEGTHLKRGIGPHVPPAYLDAIEGVAIGPNVGSCGTAAFTKKLVIVSDINTDPLWEDYKDVALKHNLQACWCQPILDSDNQVLGTFALYYHETRAPQPNDIDLIQRAAHLGRNAIIHKQVMTKIITSQLALEEAQKLAHVGNWKLNLKNDTLVYSHQLHNIFEFTGDELPCTYQTLLEKIHPKDIANVKAAYEQCLKTDQVCETDYRILFNGERIKHIKSRLEAIRDSSGAPITIIGTVQDISQIVIAQTEKELTLSKMEHVQRLESLGVLAGGIAHDFNNILTAILGNAELARNHMPDTSSAHHHIEQITQASQKAANLCKQMLAYSGKGKFMIKPINLSELVGELSQLLQVTIPKNVVLRIDLNQQVQAIDADVTQMQQVIMNLVINGAEAIAENSGALSIATGVTRLNKDYLASTFVDENLKEGLYTYLEVSDTGCGMSEETRQRIFEPFFTTKFTGRGLGMAAILGIVRGHNGAIKTYSELGKGTTFKVFFPVSKQQAAPLNVNTKANEAWHGEGCVLVIDDEETIREVAVDMLNDMGLKSYTASDGVEGVEMYQLYQNDIDVVLMDMTMPRMGGGEAFSEMCRINPNVKVILSSGYNEQDATSRFAGKGLAGFLQKPYTPDELAAKLAAILADT